MTDEPNKSYAAAAHEFNDAVHGCMFAVFDELGIPQLVAWLARVLAERAR